MSIEKIKRYKERPVVIVKGMKLIIRRFIPSSLTLILVIPLTTQHKWIDHQIDVKSAFMNGVLGEEMYIEQPLEYNMKGGEYNILKLKKELYRLKEASRT